MFTCSVPWLRSKLEQVSASSDEAETDLSKLIAVRQALLLAFVTVGNAKGFWILRFLFDRDIKDDGSVFLYTTSFADAFVISSWLLTNFSCLIQIYGQKWTVTWVLSWWGQCEIALSVGGKCCNGWTRQLHWWTCHPRVSGCTFCWPNYP